MEGEGSRKTHEKERKFIVPRYKAHPDNTPLFHLVKKAQGRNKPTFRLGKKKNALHINAFPTQLPAVPARFKGNSAGF